MVGDWRGQSLIRGLKDRITELETRLEIEPDIDCDGIEARNATIHLLERRIEEYREEVKGLQDKIL
jgi:predicted RNase H-like nuclease (RuvC/YqgF family)